MNYWFIALFVFSVIWGRGILFMRKHGISKKAAMWLMRYIMQPFSVIEDVLLNLYYNGVGLIGILCFSLLLHVPLGKLFTISWENCRYIVIAPLAVLSFANIFITVITPVFKGDRMVKAMMDVPWIQFTSRLNPKIGPLIPLVGAFLEEIFFRGVVFYYAYYVCRLPFGVALLISLLLFGLQQGLFTENLMQFFMLLFGTLIVTVVSSAVMVLSSSVIPALLAHEIFVIFYFRKMGFEYKTIV